MTIILFIERTPWYFSTFNFFALADCQRSDLKTIGVSRVEQLSVNGCVATLALKCFVEKDGLVSRLTSLQWPAPLPPRNDLILVDFGSISEWLRGDADTSASLKKNGLVSRLTSLQWPAPLPPRNNTSVMSSASS
ncbi:3839_t:CDS:2 [Funneliformis mosseae]|uniref:3839_t:CDS:1 n=1 Tax=Funneliformis mosseae TaxID=27381 RepID=A0A9N9E9I5_FUNMO|nr:3839_t:CDS:2 [Funneliformis mosseae]